MDRVYLVLDTVNNSIPRQSFDVLKCAAVMAGNDRSRILAIVPGSDCTKHAQSCSDEFGIATIALEHHGLRLPNPDLLAALLDEILTFEGEICMCFSNTVNNAHTVSRLAIQHNASSITAVDSVSFKDGTPLFTRSIFNGKCRQVVAPASTAVVATFNPGGFPEPTWMTTSESIPTVRTVRPNITPNAVQPVSLEESSDTDEGLEEADVIVSAGRGIGARENLELIRSFAGIIRDSAIGASRPIVDNRWLPYSRQVGVTGRRVAPRVYIACGISGAHQHVVGMKDSQCIIAINTDPHAAIFDIADYGIVADLAAFVPLVLKTHSEKSKGR
ncbi:MAG TPA: electron transfer flavoprotein subunit alpha/FixB family protein [Spirochaetota bacterium]|nr:electron transfer flavoprotein subunit alpha/FixB family protein [Spirochaetota bacterium]HNT10663.1 electron transfer flavoprotein subunit alpha/FixB family protein [Spirochaetota bacterium]HOS38443.1 electron transfer flavoprotein subunit alpha/FixB family protein [Spirochaetota bacterium]